jgi:hypothetical protein
MTSNQIMTWGATLLDFWWFRRLPGVPFERVASSSEIVNTLRHMVWAHISSYNLADKNYLGRIGSK